MPGLILHAGASMMCAHPPGRVDVSAPAQQRVFVDGRPVVTTADTLVVTGCGFPAMSLGAPPCTSIQWSLTSTRVLVNGLPALLQPTPPPGFGSGVGVGTPPPNPPMVQIMQCRVWGM
ncbi:hypothetical protein [Streptomyces sp. NPDC002265]|uniref:hypothetical protein n=1 Tax=Streptomyces sp. NPDC002265 TaxID=3154415 RepID=UPI003316B720